jgi:hypothetical protein
MSKAADLANLIGNINAGGGGVNRNVIINGAMNVAQRSTSETGKGDADGYFTCDRWNIDVGVSGDASAGRFTMSQDSSAPSGFANSLKLACTTADTSIASGERLQLQQLIEGQNLQAFAKGTSDAKPFAVSFYVKGNASATYVCELFDLDNTRQCSKTFNVTTDWTRVKLTFPADTTGTFDDDNAASLMINIFLHAGSGRTSGTLNSSGFASSTTANRAVGISSFFDSTSRTFFITGVQLEVGQNPTSFEVEPFATTLLKCQRYFHAVSGAGHPFPIDSAYARYITHSQDSNGTKWYYEYPVEMRAIPTLELNNISSSTVQHYNYNASASYNMTGTSLAESGTRHAHISFTFASGISVGQTVSWRWLNNPNASWNFKAEL